MPSSTNTQRKTADTHRELSRWVKIQRVEQGVAPRLQNSYSPSGQHSAGQHAHNVWRGRAVLAIGDTKRRLRRCGRDDIHCHGSFAVIDIVLDQTIMVITMEWFGKIVVIYHASARGEKLLARLGLGPILHPQWAELPSIFYLYLNLANRDYKVINLALPSFFESARANKFCQRTDELM